jgi:hypothetical protein
MKLLDAQGRDVMTAKVDVLPVGRILQSRLPNVATAITTVTNTAYFVYMGCMTTAVRIKFVEFYVNSAASGAQTAEVGLFSTANPPNKSPQGTNGIVKLIADGTLTSLTTTGLKRNTTAFNSGNGYVVPVGTHLWAGIRTAMATSQPALAGLCMDFSQGLVLSTTSAGALTGAGPWTGSLITPGSYLNTAIAPDLRVTLD